VFIDNALFLFIEGMDRDSAGQTSLDGGKVISTADLTDFAEFRMDGPQIQEQTKNYFEINVSVNILAKATMDNDIHKIYRHLGIIEAAFTNIIPVFKCGNGPEDNPDELLGCLVLQTNNAERVRTNNFGQIREDLKVIQVTVEGHYKMFLKGE
jgi:hypothetical protein